MVIATVNTKGGVGKSTISAHLAGWLAEQGYSVALIDADRQSTSSRWLEKAEPKIKVVQARSPKEMYDLIPALYRDVEVLVADGPAGYTEETRVLMIFADLALIPCGATEPELDATGQAIELLHQARISRRSKLPHALFVPNRIQERTILSRELAANAHEIGIPVARTSLHLRQAFADAPGQQSFVWRMGKRAEPASTEMHQLFDEVITHGKKAFKNAEA